MKSEMRIKSGTILCAVLLAVSVAAWPQQQLQQPEQASGTPPQTNQQPSQVASPPQQVQPAEQAREAQSPESLHVMVGRSLVIDSPGRLKRVSIADPAIADAVIVSPHQILVNGKAPGAVSLVLWDESGQNQSFEVVVELDALDLQQKIRDGF